MSSDDSVAKAWNVLEVENHPFSIRYRSGYRTDAQQVSEWAIFGYESVQEVYSHELQEAITFDLYPAEEYQKPHGNMMFSENTLSASMVTPSEYDGGYSNESMFYRHGITHEYAHAAQKNALGFHTHANWMMEGFAEAVAVYHTDDEIYESYHTGHERARATRQDIRRGFGNILGVNEYVYRGSMHLLEFMFEEYGTQAVGEIFEQDAKSMTEAMQMRLEIDPLDLEADWLAYAQREIGGDYTDQIERLGGTVSAFLAIDSSHVFEPGSITVEKAVYQDDDYALVVYDEEMTAIGRSETIPAGEQSTDITISLERDVPEPHPVTVRLHHADQSGSGDPVTVNGSPVERSVLYSTSQASIRFSVAPAAGDTAVTVDAFVASDYSTGKDDVMLRIMNGNSSDGRDQIDGSYTNLSPGASAPGLRIRLDENASSVPLSWGQTITANLIDDQSDETIAAATYEVGGSTGTGNGETSTDRQMTTTDEQGSKSRDTQQAETTSGSGPGVGILGTLAGLGGVGYLLRSRTDSDSK